MNSAQGGVEGNQTEPDKVEPPNHNAKDDDLPNKQAVVIIHGIGEQVPMETLRGFVDTVWVTDEDLIEASEPDGDTGGERKRNPVWTKPDRRNRSFELRRITTEFDKNKVRTDFYEFYWAHLMHGTKLEQVWAWIGSLLWRPARKVPDNVMIPWNAAWFLITFVPAALFWVRIYKPDWLAELSAFFAIGLVAAIVGLVAATFRKKLVTVAGDVVRYVEAKPPNVARRQEIREQGVRLLETLMGIDDESVAANAARIAGGKAAVWKPKYRRIIVVGHSLGSIVGYDILKHAFARVHGRGLDHLPDQPARRRLETYCRLTLNRPRSEFDVDTFRKLQRAAFEELREHGSPWVVSDFVTLGAALTHVEFLMADDEDDAQRQQFERILPTCPPTLEWDRHTRKGHFSYRNPDKKIGKSEAEATIEKRANRQHFRYPHHAAHFAFTRWTNLHSPSYKVLWGDLVSGPVGKQFGLRKRDIDSKDDIVLAGAKDVKVLDHMGPNGDPKSAFTHLDYWSVNAAAPPGIPPRKSEFEANQRIPSDRVPHHVRELRKAIDLLYRRDKLEPNERLFR